MWRVDLDKGRDTRGRLGSSSFGKWQAVMALTGRKLRLSWTMATESGSDITRKDLNPSSDSPLPH